MPRFPSHFNYRWMKDKFTDEIKEIIHNSVNWAKYEVQYAKLTAAEKMTVLGTAVAIGAVVMMLAIVVLLMLSFALKGVFQMWMATPLAYLCVAGVWILFILIVFLFRKKLISDPIAKFITRLFFDKRP